MKRQLKNRRSASSCSMYSQNSTSLASLEPLQPLAQPQKQKKLDYPELQKQYLQLYAQLKKSHKAQAPIQKQTVGKWKQALKAIILQNREYYRSLTHSAATLRLSLSQFQVNKQEEIRRVREAKEEEIRNLEDQIERKIRDVSGEFSRKEQEYKEIISKFIDALHKSQRNWSRTHTELSNRLKKAEQLFKSRIEIDSKNQQIYEQIANFTSEYAHAQQDQSLGSINLSYDQLALHAPLRVESRRNTIDISSIQEIQDQGGQGESRVAYGLQECLTQLISWGFFHQRNQTNIHKLSTITKNLQNPEQLTKQPIFPILLQSIKLQLNLQAQENSLTSQANSSFQLQNNNRIVMRDIENQINIL